MHTHTFIDTLYIPTDDYLLLLWSTDGKHVILYYQLEAQIKPDIYFCCLAVCVFPGAGSISPVNDLCGAEWFNCSKAERQGRCKLACLYRLLDLYGHSHFPNTYITVSTHIHCTLWLFSTQNTNCFSNPTYRTDCAHCHFACNKIRCFCSDNTGYHSYGLSVRTMQKDKRIAAIVERIDRKLQILLLLWSVMTHNSLNDKSIRWITVLYTFMHIFSEINRYKSCHWGGALLKSTNIYFLCTNM